MSKLPVSMVEEVKWSWRHKNGFDTSESLYIYALILGSWRANVVSYIV